MNRKAYARVSGEPGKTQTINYYNILKRSRQLRKIFLLVDIRHEPSDNDKMMYDWVVATCFEPVVIATKADKIKRSQLQKQLKIVREGLGMSKEGKLIAFSAETKQGLEDIYNLLEADIIGAGQ